MMSKRLGSVSQTQWQRAVNAEAKLCSVKTLTNSWRFLSSVIREATGQQVMVTLPQLIPADRPFLEPEQIKPFLDAIHGTIAEIPALLALCSLRRSEIRALTWENDIDLDKGLIYVNGAAVVDEHNKVVKKRQTKNATSRRTVPMIPQLKAALLAVEKKQGPVVTMNINYVYRYINKVCETNGLPTVGLHGLRHSFASLAYHLGLKEKTTMQIGGWSNDQTMKRIYTHLSKTDITQEAAAFTSFFIFKNDNGIDNAPPKAT